MRSSYVTSGHASSIGIRLDIESRRDEIHAHANQARPAIRSEERARMGVLLQQAAHSQGDRFGLVAIGQLIGCFLDERDDLGRLMVTTFGVASPVTIALAIVVIRRSAALAFTATGIPRRRAGRRKGDPFGVDHRARPAKIEGGPHRYAPLWMAIASSPRRVELR